MSTILRLANVALIAFFAPLTCLAVDRHIQGLQDQAPDEFYNEYKVQAAYTDQAIIYKNLEDEDQLLTGIALVDDEGRATWSRTIAEVGLTSVGTLHTYHYGENGLLTAIDPEGRISWQTQPDHDWPIPLYLIPLPQGGVYIVDYTSVVRIDRHGNQRWALAFDPYLPGGELSGAIHFSDGTIAIILDDVGSNPSLLQLSPEGDVIRHHDLLENSQFPDHYFESGPLSDILLFADSHINRYDIEGSLVDQWVADPSDGNTPFHSTTSDYLVSENDRIMMVGERFSDDEVHVAHFNTNGNVLWNHYIEDPDGAHVWSFSPQNESGRLFVAGWVDLETLVLEQIDSSFNTSSTTIDSSFRGLNREQLAGMNDIAYVVTDTGGTTDYPHLYSVDVPDGIYTDLAPVEYPYHTRLDGFYLKSTLEEPTSIITVGTVRSTFLSGEKAYISKSSIGGSHQWSKELSGEDSFALGVTSGFQTIYAVSSGVFGNFSGAPLYVEALDSSGNSLWTEELEEGGYSLNGISHDGSNLLFFGRNEHGDKGRVTGFLYMIDVSGDILFESHYGSAWTNETIDAIRTDDGVISIVAVNEISSHEPTHCTAVRQDGSEQSVWEIPLGSEYERSHCSGILRIDDHRILVSTMTGEAGGLEGVIWELDASDGSILNTQTFTPKPGFSVDGMVIDQMNTCVLVAFAETDGSEADGWASIKCLDSELEEVWEIFDQHSAPVENLSMAIGKHSAALGLAVSSEDDLACMEIIQFNHLGHRVTKPWRPSENCGSQSKLFLDFTTDDFLLGGYTGSAPENDLNAISLTSFSDVMLQNGFE